ncbi:uncharacterized protein LOC116351065 [Contarinia nasturtii]|uniref:uncharacterized protein LOC116351065 n=1 Tax=Contarinia nasturtii TaxID=265458 RepID=UPI0012D482D8|nr:uncharacterized protein LOC116351065 [Contarinia nasturtii]XP_031638971.1 uncharacterized protein LOC116351065 [Contarinia nasturtii]XP_031638972.1 uncharacterized protein LOC116351065 [Contarinia nasturtii]XP_031638973.1 uncharacterized protein LOC116351065 [Contarinia nasturtii]
MASSEDAWLKFFEHAGVLGDVAAKYARSFHEHRMTMDMLTELNDMGITCLTYMGITSMGDIILILRHAQNVNKQNNPLEELASSKQDRTAYRLLSQDHNEEFDDQSTPPEYKMSIGNFVWSLLGLILFYIVIYWFSGLIFHDCDTLNDFIGCFNNYVDCRIHCM